MYTDPSPRSGRQKGTSEVPFDWDFRMADHAMPHSYASILTHIVYSTKNRIPQIDAALEERLFPYLAGIVKQLGGNVHIINGVPDHVHLLMETPATITLAELIGKVKGSSSKWIHETFPEHARFQWQRGYGAFSVSRSNVPAVARYIERQKIHHRKATFTGEFLALLRKHEIDIDEKYLWT